MAKLMLVEDDNNLREIYEARLQAEGYQIVTARDGEEALVVAKAENPDLIISDVMMPKISGFEMLDILRNTEGLKDVKVIMLTALGQSDDQQRADRLGADRYLVKSQVTLEDIVKVAHDLLDGAAAQPAAAQPAAPVPAPAPAEATTTPPPAQSAPATPVPAPTPTPPPPAPVQPAPPAEPAQPAPPPMAPDPAPTPATDAAAQAIADTAAQTEASEAAAMEAKIENFVAGATEEATTPIAPPTLPAPTPELAPAEPAAVTPPEPAAPAPTPPAQTPVAPPAPEPPANASPVNTVPADPVKPAPPEPAAPEPASTAVTNTAQMLADRSTGEINEDKASGTPDATAAGQGLVQQAAAPAVVAPKTDEAENENVAVAHKKVISPLASTNKKDIHVLLAEEEAKGTSTTPPQIVTGDGQAKPKGDGNSDLHNVAL